jgi:hypothetical protein
MSIRFEDTGPPAGEPELAELEDRAGHPLPVAYRDFLEAHDGATPEANHLPDAAGGAEIAVRSFFSVEEVLRQLDTLGPDRVPEEMLPIADDDFGSGLFVNLEDGSVWSWDPEQEDPEEVDLWAAFTREAEDLDELLDRLEPEAGDPDDEPEPLDEGYIDAESFRGDAPEPED